MSRRRSIPWIHRWSRPIIGAIATVGMVLTAYLTITKLSGASVGCAANAAANAASCNDVLNSAYATVFGLPLSLFGFLAYAAMTAFALVPLTINRETSKDLRNQLEHWTWLLLLIGSTAMAVFSGYLMFVLATKLNAVCPYCIGSALFSVSLLGLTLFGRDWDDIGQIAFTGLIVAMITLVGTLAVYANVDGATTAGDRKAIPSDFGQAELVPGKGWDIKTTSGPSEIALAEYLTTKGAKMYGAYWCPHCHEQKLLFGKEAFSKINYIECASPNSQTQLPACAAAKIESYPTWDINGKLEKGAQPMEKLTELTGYTGEKNFKYFIPGR
ncbi:vitamin K epoxide reductase family protein [Oscillatoria sp. FACHB-1406]|uniref:vitamin K epoxide reductase family protein n=1 Tax=Oscillatoria sp. FACHB-1406 TaxID=2692846 RepID=UPI001686D6E7|nr:vitamin K epoxide reductase family protein [Oscillatoria sp. FACHB-1406]MBD2578700.1 vitamin K epoxide reductase family protein [Oscillatoria sp. FACHB-1406]